MFLAPAWGLLVAYSWIPQSSSFCPYQGTAVPRCAVYARRLNSEFPNDCQASASQRSKFAGPHLEGIPPKVSLFQQKFINLCGFSWSFFPHVMQFFLRFCCDSEQLMVYTNIEQATKKCQTNCKLISLFGTLDPSSPWQTWPSHRTHVLPRSPGGLKRRKNPLKKPLWKEKRQRPVRLHSHLHLYIII